MNAHTRIVSILLVVGLVGLGGYKAYELWSQETRQLLTTDAKNTKGSIRVARDGWVGYFHLCSPQMETRLRQQGYLLECVDDQADYEARFRKLDKGEYQFAVGTVDSYVQNGAASGYPGPIVAVIDESKGGDAIVARASRIDSIEAFKTASDFKVAFTPNSPSEHLLRALRSHFDITQLSHNGRWRLPVQGSEEALEKLKKGEVDVAVLWEPDVTRAQALPGIVRLLGTENTRNLIVDVLIANPKVLRDQPELVSVFLKTWFQTQQYYRQNPAEWVDALKAEYKLNSSQIEQLVNGVDWKTLTDNMHDWYGGPNRQGGQEYLVDSINSAVNILMDDQVFSRNPLPDSNPYRLINSSVISQLYETLSAGDFQSQNSSAKKDRVFKSLSAADWQQLRAVGMLKVRPIQFASGTADLTLDGKREIDSMMERLQHYPNFRIEIRGHTGTRGDEEANRVLSQDRADAVYRYIDITYGTEANRYRAVGLGGSQPLPMLPGESNRAYGYRLPRVEIVLVSGEI
ncbi:MAG: OmpA family protein [Hahellaceae bacterium]|nr:OmpA family protein [Hahellaceae bacterium]MCP5168955.1 OmpA family protein [Hahellaceae bacterium]